MPIIIIVTFMKEQNALFFLDNEIFFKNSYCYILFFCTVQGIFLFVFYCRLSFVFVFMRNGIQ